MSCLRLRATKEPSANNSKPFLANLPHEKLNNLLFVFWFPPHHTWMDPLYSLSHFPDLFQPQQKAISPCFSFHSKRLSSLRLTFVVLPAAHSRKFALDSILMFAHEKISELCEIVCGRGRGCKLELWSGRRWKNVNGFAVKALRESQSTKKCSQ